MSSEGAYGQMLLWRMLGALTRETLMLIPAVFGWVALQGNLGWLPCGARLRPPQPLDRGGRARNQMAGAETRT